MNPWLETVGVTLLALCGAAVGHWCSKLPKLWWASGYLLAMAFVGLLAFGRNISQLEFLPPVSWCLAGRTEYALGGFVAALALTSPLSRLPGLRQKVMVSGFAALFILLGAIWPFLAPALTKNYFASLKTNIDSDGVCHQSTEYNCGPAAAVTALRSLGLSAEEGELAVLAHTSSAIGTPTDLLNDALQSRYGAEGLVCEYRRFNSVAELPRDGLTLAVIKFGFLVDHYVTVLEVSDRQIIVGDPWRGKAVYAPEEFAKQWRFTGIVLRKQRLAGVE